MHNWLGVAVVAYLLGALIEGVSMIRELSQALPELLESAENDPSHPAESPRRHGGLLAVVTVVSITGAFCWPCRLIHRLMKENQAPPEE